ncbi:ER membrane protein complex subunit 10 [Episyrphus balteatus]|uniref:ER membrane protein complex subunit 10 n=1 Tax=Episyrphus balteatus TaxID=286459 RepID=UPI0024853436|nr:ER membrane protein complex subunit 10 [Episyrphus balteatus]
MGSSKLLFLLITFSFVLLGSCYLENDGWISIELKHALDASNPEKFSHRGNVTIPSLFGQAKTYQEVLTQSERQSLKRLAETDEFYRLQANVVYPDGTTHTFLTATKACNLVLSDLYDVLWVSIDGTGFVTAVTQTIFSSAFADCKNSDISISGLDEFNTDVLIKHMELAPIPDTASFIQKVEREREAREKGEVRDNRGFFAKYWMYIVPVVLLVFISGATNQDGAK